MIDNLLKVTVLLLLSSSMFAQNFTTRYYDAPIESRSILTTSEQLSDGSFVAVHMLNQVPHLVRISSSGDILLNRPFPEFAALNTGYTPYIYTDGDQMTLFAYDKVFPNAVLNTFSIDPQLNVLAQVEDYTINGLIQLEDNDRWLTNPTNDEVWLFEERDGSTVKAHIIDAGTSTVRSETLTNFPERDQYAIAFKRDTIVVLSNTVDTMLDARKLLPGATIFEATQLPNFNLAISLRSLTGFARSRVNSSLVLVASSPSQGGSKRSLYDIDAGIWIDSFPYSTLQLRRTPDTSYVGTYALSVNRFGPLNPTGFYSVNVAGQHKAIKVASGEYLPDVSLVNGNGEFIFLSFTVPTDTQPEFFVERFSEDGDLLLRESVFGEAPVSISRPELLAVGDQTALIASTDSISRLFIVRPDTIEVIPSTTSGRNLEIETLKSTTNGFMTIAADRINRDTAEFEIRFFNEDGSSRAVARTPRLSYDKNESNYSQNSFIYFGSTGNEDIVYYVTTTYGVEELALNRVDLRGPTASVEVVDPLFLEGIIPPNLGVNKIDVFSQNDTVFVLTTMNNNRSNFLLKAYDIGTSELLLNQRINTVAASGGRAEWFMTNEGFSSLQFHDNRDFVRHISYSNLGIPIDSADVDVNTFINSPLGWTDGPSSNRVVFIDGDTYYQVRYQNGHFESRSWDLSDLPHSNWPVTSLKGDSIFVATTRTMLPDTGRINLFARSILPTNTLVGIIAPSSGEEITLSPNPARQTIRLSKELVFAKASEVRILATATGQVLQTLTFSAGESLSHIDVRHLPSGNYVLQVAGQEVNAAQFIVQR
ncbi:MAG: hypothetical protein AB8F78_07880 [Saprospiraceae bacterium]